MNQYVSRGGEKLSGAIKEFKINLKNKVCADVGAATGGFTDYLLQNGAKKVYAIDVGYGLLDWKLRNDPRVAVMERTNVKTIKELPKVIDLITIDVSFISLRQILPVVKNWVNKDGGQVLALVKPQFEATYKETSRGKGVITDEEVHGRVLDELSDFAKNLGYQIKGIALSPIRGRKGNKEYFLWLSI